MSIVSIFRRNKGEKTELRKKNLVKKDKTNLNEETKLNIEDLSLDSIDESKLIKLTDKGVIAKILCMLPNVDYLLVDKKNRAYKFTLPSVGGNLSNAIDIKGNTTIDLSGLELDENLPIAEQVSKYITKNNKEKSKKVENATLVIVSATLCSKKVANEIKKSLYDIRYVLFNIDSFLSNEFKSKVEEASLFLDKSITFMDEIIVNEDRRKEQISQIENHISLCIQLLKQAVLSVSEGIKDIKDNYYKYEKEIYELNQWIQNIEVLYGLIAELCKLDYLYYQGVASLESCEYDLKLLEPDIKELLLGLSNWHQIEHLKLDINLATGEYKSTGIKSIIRKFLSRTASKGGFDYTRIPDDVLRMINKQMNMKIEKFKLDSNEIFNSDIDIAILNGELYYYTNNSVC